MRIGLISDTHGYLRPEVFDRLMGVERILHAGDVGDPGVLSDLETIAPVLAVWGNTDSFDVRACTHARLEVDLAGMRFGLTHGHRITSFDRLVDQFPGVAVVVHGHSHVPRNDLVRGVRMLNPGSAGPGGTGWAPSVAIAEIRDGAIEVVHLDVASGAVILV